MSKTIVHVQPRIQRYLFNGRQHFIKSFFPFSGGLISAALRTWVWQVPSTKRVVIIAGTADVSRPINHGVATPTYVIQRR